MEIVANTMPASVTLVLAAYNSGALLDSTLESNLASGFDRIVIVDGMSNDTTRDVVSRVQAKFPGRVELHSLPKKGLANARNYGSAQSNTDLIMHAGPDNHIPGETLQAMCEQLGTYDLVSCRTRLRTCDTYLSRVHNLYKKRYSAGAQDVVGTPYLGARSLFQAFPFDEQMLNSDDTELCHRLAEHGKRLYRVDASCYESGFESMASVMERWSRWGRGDALFYKKMRSRWTLKRKVISLLHPLQAELVSTYRVLPLGEFLSGLPFFVMVCGLRYYGWLRYLVCNK
jgi:glycosyltransferase involved in cell wall biosynthesis